MGRNKGNFYNYKVTIYHNKDRTNIADEKLFKMRQEVCDAYGISASSVVKLTKPTVDYLPKYIYMAVESVRIPMWGQSGT